MKREDSGKKGRERDRGKAERKGEERRGQGGG